MEFGIVAPVMAIFLMAIVDLSEAIIKYRLLCTTVQQTGLMSTQLAVQADQTNVLTTTTLNVASSVIFALFPGLANSPVYYPGDPTPPPYAITVTEITFSSNTPAGCMAGLTCTSYTANVSWSVPLQYGQPLVRSCGTETQVSATANPQIVNGIPTTVPTSGITNALTSVLAVDGMYQYKPFFGRFIGPITMRQSGYFNPRPYTTSATLLTGAAPGGVACAQPSS